MMHAAILRPISFNKSGATAEVVLSVGKMKILLLILSCLVANSLCQTTGVLVPPYFNIAEGKSISATSTCADEGEAELYCKLAGNTGVNSFRYNEQDIVDGQYCDYCETGDSLRAHPAEYAIDGTEKWWQSPPLSRSFDYSKVNLTIDLAQLYHVAYVLIKFANSPRPGTWVLEKSVDYGETYQAWQYFADTPSDCLNYFGMRSLEQITNDDDIICTTEYSGIVPLEDGEIVVSLINGRPGAKTFYDSPTLKEFTRATNVRLRLLQTKTLLGHLMAIQQLDPTVTRRYFYSIKDISIGGRCVCNGHANACDTPVPGSQTRLMCTCSHNTCGAECETCCPGFVQKKWKPATPDSSNECEPCNCYGHSNECVYDESVAERSESIDIYGNYSGGGVCTNCRDNTQGINCNECISGFYQVQGEALDSPYVCRQCECDLYFSTGNCASSTGVCECRPQFTGEGCSECSPGYYSFPECRPCDCHVEGTYEALCQANGGQCPCKRNYVGLNCDSCAPGFYNFPDCIPCGCNLFGTVSPTCGATTGQCRCQPNFAGRACDQCNDGYYSEFDCIGCDCDIQGTLSEICDKVTSECLCKSSYTGARCDQCAEGFYNYPYCYACSCDISGTGGQVQCNNEGQCPCLNNFGGMKCDACNVGYYNFPDCQYCGCNLLGTDSEECDQLTGQCYCYNSFKGRMCEACNSGFYNFPTCEECDCDPAGVEELPGQPLGGCGAETKGACICKSFVEGRSCDTCRPLYWNLQLSNPDGCERCNCFTPGTVSGSDRCNTVTGQCFCKLLTNGRICDECRDGAYQLTEGNSFGCTACNCDVGGAATNVCDKTTGNCICKARIRGQNCDQPERAHYFPDLYQYKYEIESGQASDGRQLRIGYDQNTFPGFSYIGYAVMSQSLQPSVSLWVPVEVPDLYRIVLRYMYDGSEPVYGKIRMTPTNQEDDVQEYPVLFKPGASPQLVTVQSDIFISPFVLNRDHWLAVIEAPSGVLLDYLVLLPSAYFEARTLHVDITEPCVAGQDQERCNYFTFPGLEQFDTLLGHAGSYTNDDGDNVRTNLFTDVTILEDLGVSEMAYLSPDQPYLNLVFPIEEVGSYVFVLEYYGGGPGAYNGKFNVSIDGIEQTGYFVVYNCNFMCRAVIMDSQNRVMIFDVTTTIFRAQISEYGQNFVFALSSIVAVPAEKWSMEFVTPTLMCVRDVNKNCLGSSYVIPVPAVRKEAERPEEKDEQFPLPTMASDRNVLYYMDTDAGRMELTILDGNPGVGRWVFVVHYYQPLTSSYEVFFDLLGEVESSGSFEAKYCPHTSGCRTVVSNAAGGTTFEMNGVGSDILITLPNGDKRTLWIDYILAIPEDRYSEALLKASPQDRTGDFIIECGSQNFYISPSTTGFCRDSVFSLTTDYNNGALSCDCNIDGSLNYYCEELGGQCPCRDHVTGRRCERCMIGFYGFPLCRECRCLSGVCNEETGQCTCPPNVSGEYCDRCLDDHYGYDPIAGCVPCDCDERGTIGSDLGCDANTGQCRCQADVAGRRCEACNPGFHSYPFCSDCNCDLSGTLPGICNQTNAECLCKENVEGDYCNRCKSGTFSLEDRNPKGCTSCFCFGVTTDCAIAPVSRGQVNTMEGWNVTNIRDPQISLAGNQINVYIEGSSINPQSTVYWVAPSEYLGDKIGSYGGKLRYRVENSIEAVRGDASGAQPALQLIRADVILSGNGLNLMYNNIQRPVETGELVEVDLLETSFRAFSGATVSRQTLMTVLADISSLQIQAQYFDRVIYASLSDVSMDTTVKDFDGVPEYSVEFCNCPVGYEGLSCQDCSEGYYKLSSGACVPCQCNNHAISCDPFDGRCLSCDHNTEGDHCDKCSTGFYGDPRYGTESDCQICPCPFAVVGSTFATTCQPPDAFNSNFNCDCTLGYTTENCSVCENGYYGNPDELGGYCEPCFCNGNLDPNAVGNVCSGSTGACLLCLEGYDGYSCEQCGNGYFGDAVVKKNCSRCNCNTCGTEQCDNTNGFCNCKRNVIGDTCDQCRPNTWNYDSCTGCETCLCGDGSVTEQCLQTDGSCICMPGVEGHKCDRCQRGYWDYGPSGCTKCNCPELLECETDSGKCICPPGATGKRCDRCEARFVFTPQGCLPCDSCVHTLLDVLDVMLFQVNNTKPGAVSIGLEAFATIDKLNDTLYNELKPGVADAGIASTIISTSLAPVYQLLDNVTENADKIDQDSLAKVKAAAKGNIGAAETLADAVEIEKFINDTYQSLTELIDNQKAKQIEEGTDDVQKRLDEARLIVANLETRNFSNSEELANKEKSTAEELLEAAKNLTKLSQGLLDEIAVVIGSTDDVIAQLQELIDLSEQAANLSLLSNQLNDANSVAAAAVQAAIASAIESFNNGTSNIIKGFDLLNLARQFLLDANDAYTKLETDYTRLDEGINRLQPVVTALAIALDNVRPLVVQSGEHAENLTSYAKEIVELSKVGTAYAEQARKAANAYKDIIEAINSASAAAGTANTAAETALEDTEGVVRAAQRLLRKGEKQKKNTEELKEEVNDLAPKMEATRISMEELRNTNDETSNQLRMIRDAIANLPTIDSNAASEAVTTAMQANDIASETKQLVEMLQGELGEYSDRLAGIDGDVTAANDALKQAEDKLDSSRVQISAARDLIQSIQTTADEVDGGQEGIELDISDIKRLVEQARGAADQIKLAVAFSDEGSYVKARSLPASDTTYTKTIFNINNATDGLLFFNGGPTKQDDFVASEIVDGRLNVIYRLGEDEPTRLISNRNVNDEFWHEVAITRLASAASLKISTPDQEDDVVEQQSNSIAAILHLSPDASFFLGGVPNEFEGIPDGVVAASYRGTVQGMHFDNHVIGLWNFEEYTGIQATSQAVTSEDQSNIGQFDGEAYLLLDTLTLSTNKNTVVELAFKSIAANGLLFYSGDEQNFLSLSLRNGHLVMNFKNGDDVSLEIESEEAYNDDQFYKVIFGRNGLKGNLEINDERILVTAQGTLPDDTETEALIQIGGLLDPTEFPHSNVVNSKGFLGCLTDVSISGVTKKLQDYTGLSEGFFFGCQHRDVRMMNLQSPGFVKMSDVTLGLEFKMVVSFRTLESAGVVFEVKENSKHISAFLEDGTLQVTGRGSSSTEFALSHNVNVSDGNWHVITLLKERNRITLYVDDVEVDAFNSESAFSISGGPLVLGRGSQSNIGFIGCIADVILDTSLLSFADRLEDDNAHFGTCVVTTLVEPAIVTLPPFTSASSVLSSTPMQLQTCALQPPAPGEATIIDPADRGAIMFGSEAFSRIEYADGKIYDETNLRKEGTLQFEIKTTAQNAMIYYTADRREIDFVGVNMLNGRIVFRFDCGSGVGVIESDSTVNDGEWHFVEAQRNLQIGEIRIDGVVEVRGESPGTGKFLNNIGKQYVGGLPEEVEANDMPIRDGFIGCMRNLTFNVDGELVDLASEKTEFGITQCKGSMEDGTFVNDGYIIISDNLNVYRKFNVEFQIKPRVTDGVIMSVRAKLDFFVVELVGGQLIARADNGNGPFEATSDQTGVSLCDGQWHSVIVSKQRSVVSILVDNIPGIDGDGDGGTTATNTNNQAFYLGGVPDDQMHDGITTTGDFVGCIKDVIIEDEVQDLGVKKTGGIVKSFCPKN
ncbi:laminin subunit alpha-like [Antedon mediterranea]|uniref:laminin subunit alpha-like n=1 Tax=Antedon mediterranea TaxID=105859 RepID=UPI003AF63953